MSTTAEFTPFLHQPEFRPGDEAFTEIEFPPTYLDFVTARRRFLDRISLNPVAAPATNGEAHGTER
jgi:hypothetical protein